MGGWGPRASVASAPSNPRRVGSDTRPTSWVTRVRGRAILRTKRNSRNFALRGFYEVRLLGILGTSCVPSFAKPLEESRQEKPYRREVWAFVAVPCVQSRQPRKTQPKL